MYNLYYSYKGRLNLILSNITIDKCLSHNVPDEVNKDSEFSGVLIKEVNDNYYSQVISV